MALRAVHAEWGTVFAHLPDSGVRPPRRERWAPGRAPVHEMSADRYGQPAPGRDSRSVIRSNSSVSGSPTSWPNSVSP